MKAIMTHKGAWFVASIGVIIALGGILTFCTRVVPTPASNTATPSEATFTVTATSAHLSTPSLPPPITPIPSPTYIATAVTMTPAHKTPTASATAIPTATQTPVPPTATAVVVAPITGHAQSVRVSVAKMIVLTAIIGVIAGIGLLFIALSGRPERRK